MKVLRIVTFAAAALVGHVTGAQIVYYSLTGASVNGTIAHVSFSYDTKNLPPYWMDAYDYYLTYEVTLSNIPAVPEGPNPTTTTFQKPINTGWIDLLVDPLNSDVPVFYSPSFNRNADGYWLAIAQSDLSVLNWGNYSTVDDLM